VIGMDNIIGISLIIILAFIYLCIVRLIRNRFVNPKLMEETKNIIKEIHEVQKKMLETKDEVWVEKLGELQIKAAKKMNALTFGQLKLMLILTLVFFIFMWIIPHFDTTRLDDIHMPVKKPLTNITVEIPENAKCGLWYLMIKENATSNTFSLPFYVCYRVRGDVWRVVPKDINVSYSEVVNPGDKLFVEFNKKIEVDEVVLNNGTRFYFDLPFRIPFLNIQRIYDVRGLFIFIIFLGGFIFNPVLDRIFKQGGYNGKEEG